MAVAENHVVSDRTIAIDRIAKARQRAASELWCKSDEQADGVVGIVASVSPELVVGLGLSVLDQKGESALDHGPTRADREFFLALEFGFGTIWRVRVLDGAEYRGARL